MKNEGFRWMAIKFEEGMKGDRWEMQVMVKVLAWVREFPSINCILISQATHNQPDKYRSATDQGWQRVLYQRLVNPVVCTWAEEIISIHSKYKHRYTPQVVKSGYQMPPNLPAGCFSFINFPRGNHWPLEILLRRSKRSHDKQKHTRMFWNGFTYMCT